MSSHDAADDRDNATARGSVARLGELIEGFTETALDKAGVDSLNDLPDQRARQRGRSVPCSNCNGRGRRRDGTFCRCGFGRERQKTETQELKDLFPSAGLPARFRGKTLDTWDEAAGDDPEKEVARSLVTELLDDGHATGPNGIERPGLFLHGPNGVGKTGLLAGLLKRVYEQGHKVLWIKWGSMIEDIQDTYDSDSSKARRIGGLQKVDALFLDEFGDAWRDGRMPDNTRSITFRVLSARHEEGRHTFLSSNLDGLSSVRSQFSPRLADRVMELCTVANVGGDNLRDPRTKAR